MNKMWNTKMTTYNIAYDSEDNSYAYRGCRYEVYTGVEYTFEGSWVYTTHSIDLPNGFNVERDSLISALETIDQYLKEHGE